MNGRMKTRKKLAKNQQLLENQQKTGKKPIFPKSVQTFSYLLPFDVGEQFFLTRKKRVENTLS